MIEVGFQQNRTSPATQRGDVHVYGRGHRASRPPVWFGPPSWLDIRPAPLLPTIPGGFAQVFCG